jgi:transposase
MEHKSVLVQKRKIPKISRKRTTLAHRLRSVLLVIGGQSTVAVGKKHGDSQRAVANWVQRYKKQGAQGLKEQPRSGRPATLSSSQWAKLRILVSKARSDSQIVSGRIVAEIIKRNFGVSLTRQHARRILNRFDS